MSDKFNISVVVETPQGRFWGYANQEPFSQMLAEQTLEILKRKIVGGENLELWTTEQTKIIASPPHSVNIYLHGDLVKLSVVKVAMVKVLV